MASKQDTPSFARLVSLACHDLRTPLATIHGFARTLAGKAELDEQPARWVEMIDAASTQMAELLDELALAARIESGRYKPGEEEIDTLELVRAVEERLGAERVVVGGSGSVVHLDRDATERALAALARCALRHGGLERVDVVADGDTVRVAPITAASAPVVLGEDLRDLGAAVAVRLVRALGGDVSLTDETLSVRLSP